MSTRAKHIRQAATAFLMLALSPLVEFRTEAFGPERTNRPKTVEKKSFFL